MSAAERTLLIVDDELPARQRLERIVGDLDGWTCAGSCSSGPEALAALSRQRPDVVLLDIEMPGMSGLEVAQCIADFDEPPAVVFATAYDQFALDAFDTRAVGYVLKPVRRERLAAALEHAGRLSPAMTAAVGEPAAPVRDRIVIRSRDELRVIALDDIRYFEADQKYTTVHHSAGEDLIEESLKQLEDEFGSAFVRVHRAYLVAIAQIDALDRLEDGAFHVRLRDCAERLPVSRRQLTELRSRLASGR